MVKTHLHPAVEVILCRARDVNVLLETRAVDLMVCYDNLLPQLPQLPQHKDDMVGKDTFDSKTESPSPLHVWKRLGVYKPVDMVAAAPAARHTKLLAKTRTAQTSDDLVGIPRVDTSVVGWKARLFV